MISINKQSMIDYCDKYKIAFEFITEKLPPITQECDDIHFIKIYARDYLEKYSRIILIDDSCYITPNTPNLFDIVPEKQIGGFNEYKYGGYQKKPFMDKLNFKVPGQIINSGLLVLTSKYHKQIYSNIDEWDPKVKNNFGKLKDQPYINNSIARYNIPVFDLGLYYNYIGSRIIKAQDNLEELKKIKIFHFTSGCGAQRLSVHEKVIKKISE